LTGTAPPTPAPVPRSRRSREEDASLARVLELPPATTDYTRTVDLPIPTRDGTVLLADHLAPVGEARGTVLVRGPYGFSAPGTMAYGGLLALYGYHVVLGRVRGTFGSGGTLDPFNREVEDAADTVAWLRRQPFFTGRFATFGGSYLGFTQWALLMDPPPELATAIIQTAPHDMSRAMHGDGAFHLDTWLGWCDQVTHQEETSILSAEVREAATARRQAQAHATLPLASAVDELCEGRAPWFREWVTHRDLSDPFWSPSQLGPALDRVEVPVLLHGGWQDLFLDQTLDEYARLHERGIDVGLTVGPWNHQGVAAPGYATVIPETLDWLAEHLEGNSARRRPSPVRIQVTGTDDWRHLPAWPPLTSDQVLHLQPGGGLSDEPAAADAPPATFTYDPTDPTPSIGGRLLYPQASGRKDDTALVERADVLSFTGPPLTAPLEVVGAPYVELSHRSDNPHADLFVRISEVDAEGRSHNVTDGFLRLDPADGSDDVRVGLDPTAHRFAEGSRVRLLVAGGCFPRFERNLGSGGDPALDTATVPSHRTIRMPGSRLVLPVD
jgi:uncharacterized protein